MKIKSSSKNDSGEVEITLVFSNEEVNPSKDIGPGKLAYLRDKMWEEVVNKIGDILQIYKGEQ